MDYYPTWPSSFDDFARADYIIEVYPAVGFIFVTRGLRVYQFVYTRRRYLRLKALLGRPLHSAQAVKWEGMAKGKTYKRWLVGNLEEATQQIAALGSPLIMRFFADHIRQSLTRAGAGQ